MLLQRPSEHGCTIWLTGRPGAAKGSLARAVGRRLREAGRRVEVLDGVELRARASRREDHVAHMAWVSRALTRNGVFVVAAPASPGDGPADRGRVVAVHVAAADEAAAPASLSVSPAVMGEPACVDAVLDALREGGHLPPSPAAPSTERTDR